MIPGLEKEGQEPPLQDGPLKNGKAEMPDSNAVATQGNLRDAVNHLQRGQDDIKNYLKETIERGERVERERFDMTNARMATLEEGFRNQGVRLGIIETTIIGAKTRLTDGWKLIVFMFTVLGVVCSLGWLILDKLDDAVRARQAFDNEVTQQLDRIDPNEDSKRQAPPPAYDTRSPNSE